MKKLTFSKDRMAEARDIRERWYRHEITDRIPFTFSVHAPFANSWMGNNPYNFKEMCESSKKAVEGMILSMQHQFDTFPDCDYLPAMTLYYMGEGILAAIYGAEQYLVERDPPYTKGRLFSDIYDTQNISNDFEIEDTEWGKILKEHVLCFMDATNGDIPVGPPDYQSPYGTATKLMPNEDLMIAMYEEPELVHNFMGHVTDGIIKLTEAMEKWVGTDLYAKNLSNPIPGKCGFLIWDDYISVITPKLHMEFCAPYNRRLFEKYGGGHLHTCGPYFPGYIDSCLACNPDSMDISIMRGMGKTREDMYEFLKITKERNMRLFGWLGSNDEHVFNNAWQNPDDEMIQTFIKGGWMPTGSGTYEEGLAFKDKILNMPV